MSYRNQHEMKESIERAKIRKWREELKQIHANGGYEQ